MKRKVALLLMLALALALLTGCGDAADESAEKEPSSSPETTQAPPALPAATEEGARGWAEPNAVDDSFSFRYEWQVTCDCAGGYDHFLHEELPAYVERWVDGGRILDSAFFCVSDTTFGWVCFSGTPKGELGWKTTEYQDEPCFCRGFTVRSSIENGERQYRVSKSIAMEPLKMLPRFEQTDEGELYMLPKTLPELACAELYVPQLGQSYVLTDPQALRGLEQAFSQPEFENEVVQEPPAMKSMEGMDGFLPLYLHYADGSGSLALAAADGSDFCMVWQGDFSSYGPVSLFERFGVPLPSPGYIHNDDGTTTIEEVVESTDVSLGLAIRHEQRYTFDAEGRLVRFEHVFHREDEEFDASEWREYHYRPDGKPDYIDIHWENERDGGHDERASYTYNELGQMTRYALNDQKDASRGMYYEYRYDELNRLAAIIYHYRDGREGLPSGNSYFWYDEQGQRHNYYVDQDGNLTGGPDGDAEDHPIRR